jgi:hypothetical protein
MDSEQTLFGLMTVAQEQQALVTRALAGLVAQQAALDRSQAALGEVRTQIEQLVATAAGDVRGQLQGAVKGFGVQWALLAAGTSAGVLCVLLLFAWGLVAWERQQIDALGDQKAALQQDVADLEAHVTALEKKGGRIKLDVCGPEKRVCVRVDPAAGAFGAAGDYRAVPKK